MVALLHISDLHRSSDDPVLNSELIAALANDKGRWPTALATGPDLIVVSGDVIQGVGLGAPDHDRQLEEQYAEATRFLEELTDRFLGGDRSRVVIVPGNHDVDWNCARIAMELVGDPDAAGLKAHLPALAFDPRSDYRWDWHDQKLLKIADRSGYVARQEHFQRFRRTFYGGVTPDPLAHDPDLFFREYPAFDLSITGFSSWFGNDCYCTVGAFDPEAMARARDLIAASSCSVHIAVWHHSLAGPPSRNDYLDVTSVQKLVDYGYRVGLHGHQHQADASVMTLRLPTAEEMALVSAGSLCVGPGGLAPGVHRQYNILDVQPARSSVRVHIRQAIGPLIFAESRRIELGNEEYVDLSWTHASASKPRVSEETRKLDEAFRAYAEKHLERAAEILSDVSAGSGPARTLKIQVLMDLRRDAELLDLLQEPRTADELMILTDALCHVRQYQRAREAALEGADRFALSADLWAQIEARIEVAEMAQ